MSKRQRKCGPKDCYDNNLTIDVEMRVHKHTHTHTVILYSTAIIVLYK